ncbi:MAG TPA: hypothetical protein VFX59_29110 [Polyangiales bacterium]|nr:hypothetical protein [Polyangiales bacterium]
MTEERGSPPGLLAGDAVQAMVSVMMAGLVIAATVLRSRLAHAGFDLILLLLRTASVAMVLRALIALWRWLARIGRDSRAHTYSLAWSDEELRYGTRTMRRDDVIGIVLPEQIAQRGAVSLQPLYVVGRPPEFWELPHYFNAELLAARLKRWRGTPAATPPDFTPPSEGPEQRYTRAAHGQLRVGEVAVPEGTGYRLRAPYGVVLALVFVIDAVLHAGPRLLPAASAAALLAPASIGLWFLWMQRRRKVRLGMAMLLTPEELLVRGPHGAVSLPWTQLQSVEVATRQAWSPFVGRYLVRSLWFQALDGTTMQFDGAFLGWPPEVIAAQAEGYRTGTLASQGSGGGGGISGTDGTITSALSAT